MKKDTMKRTAGKTLSVRLTWREIRALRTLCRVCDTNLLVHGESEKARGFRALERICYGRGRS